MKYTLFVKALSLMVNIGLYEQEKTGPQEILCDLEIDIDSAEITDNIEDTLNYAELSEHLVAQAATTKFELLEPFAVFLLNEIGGYSKVKRAKITLLKSNPDVLPGAQGCGIVMEKSF